ncbi:MAG: magnesium-translocating P-type ATPase [Candidatus Omnitrophica bacterium]|nr:magnesium-translocating P-type ATPase [Candidatus Omnitrophota bacterium]
MNNKQKNQTLDFDYKGCAKEVLFEKLQTSASGLSEAEAQKRLDEYGFNESAKKQKRAIVFQFILKFFHPLVLLLVVIAGVTFWTGDPVSGSIIGLMAIMSVVLGFFQEYRADKEAERLSEMVRATATVYRNGKSKEIPIRQIVPGDIVDLFAGDMIPADLRIIQAKDLFVNQAALTGESMPVEKTATVDCTAFMGSSVVSGTALGVVLRTGLATEFGAISKRLASINQPTSFDRGINQFVWLMIRAMVVLVVAICSINYFTKGNFMEALLFSLAVAIGLTPEMLPMLVTINLSKGAIAMSKKEVIVKRLNSIQNFGAMDVLCTDKTGTLTLDKIVLERYCDIVRKEDEGVLKLAYINSFYQTGLKNILDKAVLKYEKLVVKQYKKIDEMPFDFSRRLMSVVVDMEGRHKIISKGAPEEILKRCTKYELDGEIEELDQIVLTDLKEEYDSLSADGFRVLAIAYKDMGANKDVYSKDDEQDLVLKGYIAFLDPPKPTARKTIEVLRKLGIELKVLTGDNDLVTKKICSEVGLDIKGLLTGDQLEKMTDDQLKESVKTTTVFARLSPMQKERVIRALHRNNHTVGYLGDGINDAPALKAADVGISVNNAVDIAKESADIILLQKNLMVLRDGVLEGRRVFGNIFKYIKMGASSNFGNMFSMTGASFFLPFLPMYPIQIILNNFLYDASQVAIPSDDVDEEYLLKSRSWNVNYIKRFMMYFGPLSSVFDYLTFGVLIFIFHAQQDLFATGWFLESMCTQTLVIHIIRTGKIPFIESWPSPFLIFTSIYIVSIALVLPYTPLGSYFKFIMPPASFFLFLVLIVGVYLWSVQAMKAWFIKKYGYE